MKNEIHGVISIQEEELELGIFQDLFWKVVLILSMLLWKTGHSYSQGRAVFFPQ